MNKPRLRRQSDIEYLKGDKFKQPQVGETWWIRSSKDSVFVHEATIVSFGRNIVKLCLFENEIAVADIQHIEFVELSKSPMYDTVSVEKLFFNKE